METYCLKELYKKNIVVYDIEIKKSIDECSQGWNSHAEMGISVACAFDYLEMRYRVYMDDNIEELIKRLNKPNTIIVGFNHIGFDNKLLRVNGLNLKSDDALINYDMLQVSREGAYAEQFAKGFKLDDHLRSRNLPSKTACGSMAPLMYKTGKIGALVDYCLNDVTQERSLFEDMWKTGFTSCAYKTIPYSIRRPKIGDKYD